MCVSVCVSCHTRFPQSPQSIKSEALKAFVPGWKGEVFYLHLWVCRAKVKGVNKRWKADVAFRGEDGFVHLFIFSIHLLLLIPHSRGRLSKVGQTLAHSSFLLLSSGEFLSCSAITWKHNPSGVFWGCPGVCSQLNLEEL